MLLSVYRGRLVLTVLVGLLTVSAVRGQDKKQPEQPGKLPSGESLMDNFIKASGGKDAYAKVKTTVIKGNLAIGNTGVAGDITLELKEPKLKHLTLDLKQFGKVEAGYNGQVAWENSLLQGPKIHDSNKDDELSLGLDIASDVNWRKDYKGATTEAEEKYEGKDVYRVKLETKKGEVEHRYFDKASGLVVRMKKPMKSQIGNFVMDVDISDYKKVGDLLMPHMTKFSLAGQKVEFRLTSVQLNVDIPDSAFELPPAVKELLKKKEQPKESGK